MGLQLSKEVRDRVAEERLLRKQNLTDFDIKVREFIKASAQQHAAATTRVSRRVANMAKTLELTEKGWKQGVGSVANVVRSIQPALDQEINQS